MRLIVLFLAIGIGALFLLRIATASSIAIETALAVALFGLLGAAWLKWVPLVKR